MSEREFWLQLRRQFLGVAKAIEGWYGSRRQLPADARFASALREAFRGIVYAIDERYEVGTREPKEKSLTG